MTADEKLAIARNWCHHIDIDHTRTWGKIFYRVGMSNYEYTPTYTDYEGTVDAVYGMVSEYVWNEINDWILPTK